MTVWDKIRTRGAWEAGHREGWLSAAEIADRRVAYVRDREGTARAWAWFWALAFWGLVVWVVLS